MSKQLLWVVAVIATVVVTLPVFAQGEPRFEASGSFSYLFADVGGSGFNDSASGPGFTGGFAFFVNDWFGIGGELGYNTGDLDIPVIAIFPPIEIGFSQWTVLFGPRFRIAQSERFRFGAEAMAGIARGSFEVSYDPGILALFPPGQGPGFGQYAFEFDFGDTVFAVLFGVHFDLRIDDRLFWRVVQPDVLITNYGNDGQAHFRISSGLGFEF